MIFRQTKASDRAFLIELFKDENVLLGFPMKTPAEVEDSANFWIDMGTKGGGITCEIHQEVAGMCVLYIPLFKKLAKAALFSLVVGQKFRKQGVGTRLIQAVEEMGKNKYDLSIVHLEVYEENYGAIALYKKLGYVTYGTQEKFIKEKGLYYSKILMEKRFD